MKTVLAVLLLAITTSIYSQTVEKYSRIRITVPDKPALDRIWSSGIDFEGTSGRLGGAMEFVASPSDLAHLTARGIAYQIVINDLAADYLRHQGPPPANPEGFGYGSMGGFFTYDEVNNQLDSMLLTYPSLVSAKVPIGYSTEGRPIFAVEIAANPNLPQNEVLYTALHHAREPEGMMSLMYYMWWLLQNCGSDAEAGYLVGNRHLWFIPVVNPDGYVYNQTTNPSGGGMWRKNRRNNGDGSYGVDLNRNYGAYEMWNSPNGGSSTLPSDDTYRGTAPFSEPETQAIDQFARSHNFKTCLNYHTYGDYLVYPWGYLSRESGDSLIYRDWTYEMIAVNHFTNGTDQQTVGYSTRGSSDDYLFGDTTKPITYTITPEVGLTGFWPSTAEILPLAQLTFPQNKLFAHLAGQYTTVTGLSVSDSHGGGHLARGTAFALHLTIKNRGLDSASGLTVTIADSTPYLQFVSTSSAVGFLASQAAADVVFPGTVPGNAIVGTPVRLFVTITDPSGYRKDDTETVYLGTPAVLFTDSASNGTSKWSTGQGWGTTSVAHTPPAAFTDSPTGNYAPMADNSLTMLTPVDLTGYQYGELRFWTKWAIDPTWDFATVEVTTDNGGSWTTLRSKLSHAGSDQDPAQSAGRWGYESYTPGLTWVEQQMDLTPYTGSQIKLRFRVMADGGQQRDGFYVDDIRLFGYNTDTDTTPPLIPPLLVEPFNGAPFRPTTLALRWDGMQGAIGYELELAFDSLFSSVVVDDSTLTDTVRTLASLQNDTGYFWRVRGRNVKGPGPWTPRAYRFSTGATAAVLQVSEGWNLLSLPITVADGRTDSLFTGVLGSAFSYLPGTGYGQCDSLTFGGGYWLRFGSPGQVPVAGHPQEQLAVPVVSGWNLIGSVSVPVPVSMIASDPPGIPTGRFFGFRGGGYAMIDTLQPGEGYWVNALQAGWLDLRPSGSGTAGTIRIADRHTEPPVPPSGIGPARKLLPAAFALDQNYPNPFNPTTTIGYALAHSAIVRLTVYNILGEEVGTLAAGRQDAGYRSVRWDASGVGSGVYLIRLTADEFTAERKMLLLK